VRGGEVGGLGVVELEGVRKEGGEEGGAFERASGIVGEDEGGGHGESTVMLSLAWSTRGYWASRSGFHRSVGVGLNKARSCWHNSSANIAVTRDLFLASLPRHSSGTRWTFRVLLEFDPDADSYSAGVTEDEARTTTEEVILLYLAPVEITLPGRATVTSPAHCPVDRGRNHLLGVLRTCSPREAINSIMDTSRTQAIQLTVETEEMYGAFSPDRSLLTSRRRWSQSQSPNLRGRHGALSPHGVWAQRTCCRSCLDNGSTGNRFRRF